MSVFPVAAGMLACQKNSYLRTLKATVVECMENIPVQAGDGGEMSSKKSKKEKKSKSTPAMNRSWNVVLSDTVLFPEGGGQPADFGTIGGIEVFDVQNKNGVPVHSTSAPLNVGDEVDVNVDWGRRWDHMQQHSGFTCSVCDLFDTCVEVTSYHTLAIFLWLRCVVQDSIWSPQRQLSYSGMKQSPGI
eukprot:m.196517 g.196517  ORF g.196517 m.196517 type:complete len:188 (+) comp18693_c0_seq5:189-752(+)